MPDYPGQKENTEFFISKITEHKYIDGMGEQFVQFNCRYTDFDPNTRDEENIEEHMKEKWF